MIAAAGTPVVAVAPGNARSASSVLGGLGVVVEHDSGGDWTFYAHLSSFGASGHVSAGTVIGYVGSDRDDREPPPLRVPPERRRGREPVFGARRRLLRWTR